MSNGNLCFDFLPYECAIPIGIGLILVGIVFFFIATDLIKIMFIPGKKKREDDE